MFTSLLASASTTTTTVPSFPEINPLRIPVIASAMRTLAGALLAICVAGVAAAMIGMIRAARRGDWYRPPWTTWASGGGGAIGGLSIFPAWAGGGWHASPLITLARWSALGAAAWLALTAVTHLVRGRLHRSTVRYRSW
jgi:hypothetical protein